MNTQVFQEKHTTGHLWWKRTWYRYYRFFEGSMMLVPIHHEQTIRGLENK